ncbi:DNA helicase UvrB [Rhodopirellula bahusiensis]|uniref:DNA helicase UvrB n=2 Tax=Rhodopirellula bahusiensis TaxID=2014065 RepID=A0A2G1WAL6_9BACT|nr:DNA helicase UvrB [Rhodopirellula bahusiensis]
MYHVPSNKTWDPTAIAERLRERNLDATVIADSVRITLPSAPPHNFFERLGNLILRTGPQHLVLSFDSQKFIRNITLEYDPLKISTEMAVFTQIGKACKEIGYWSAPDREIALRYCPDSAELRDLLDKVEQMQIEKENLVAKQDFEQAAQIRDAQTPLEQRIDAILFEATNEPDNSADNPAES